jgi:hypothetical protein
MSQQIIAITWSHQHSPLNFVFELALSKEEIKQCHRLLFNNKR